ncbi:M15 family metallopeptidase [Labrys sedimenti]|uniref:M15 family metallopeptidase n=1 Tax=Labrys sedimenti TaxID=3106036 RepID=UPI002ACA6B3B|nr:M15 family metallopeptidase [Labrys sp. ZIDIC5]MDZ5448633.1 M15 family metallopeptidase [Labrys sp. ZIDIC5]
MIRLPDSSAVGPTPNANSGRPVASVDLTGEARGLQQAGAGIQQAADAGFRVAETFKTDIDKQKAWDTATRWQDFQNKWQTKAQGMADSMQPGGVGTMDAFRKDYRADAQQFYSTLPEDLKGAYRPQIYDYEGRLGGTLNTKVLTEKTRYAGEQQTQMDNSFVNEAAANPTDPNAAKAAADKIKAYTLANPNLPPIDKQTRLAKVNDTVATGLGSAIVANKDSVRQVFAQTGTTGNQQAKGPLVFQPPADAASLPKGLSVNNPLNLKYSKNDKIPGGKQGNSAGAAGVIGPSQHTDQGDPQVIYATRQDGLVAGINLLRDKYAAGMRTPQQIIAGVNGWTHGNVSAAATVAKNMGIGLDDDIKLNDPVMAQKFMRALIVQEQGADAAAKVSDAEIANAVSGKGGSQPTAAPQSEKGLGYNPNEGDVPTGGPARGTSTSQNVPPINPQYGSRFNYANVQNMGDPRSPGWGQNNLVPVQAGGQTWQVNKQAASAFQGFLGDLAAAGYPLKSSGGFNYRNVRGGSELSQHAFGTAIDIDAENNAMGSTKTNLPPNVRELAAKWGLVWGMDIKGRPDPMHFEWAGPGGVQNMPSGQADPYSVARSYFQRQFGDNVDPDILNRLANAAVTARNQFNADARQLIGQVSQDAPTAIANGGKYTGAMPSRQDFEDAFGREAGQKYTAFQASLQTAQQTFDMGTQSDADVKATVAAAKSKMDATTGEGAALAASQYETAAKAAEATLKARAGDIVGYTQQHFPNVKHAWETYASNPSQDALATAIGATTAAQAQLGTKGTDQAVLPANIVDDFVARTKQPNRTTEQNMQDLAGVVFATNDPGQQLAIFDQLRKAGIAPEAETVLRAYRREDKASARFLAAVIDAKNIPEKKEQGGDTVADAVDRQMTDPATGIARTLYGLDIGREGNLETYTTDRNVFIKGVKVKVLEGMTQNDAVKFVNKALYGDARIVDQGNARITVSGTRNDEAIVQGLSHQMGAVRQALTSYGLVHGMDGTPDERNTKAVIERLNQFRANDIASTGTWRDIGDGFGFVDNATGLFVAGKDGKPLIISPDRAEAEGLLRQSADETVKKNLSATPKAPVNAPPPGNNPANVRPQSEFQPSANMDGLGFNPPEPKQDSLMDFIPADQKAGPVPSMDSILKPEGGN